MIGDKLVIEEHHTARAAEIYPLLVEKLRSEAQLAVSVAGESGAGKSELAYELYRLLNEKGTSAGILQQDDYFVFPPRTNHEMRKRNVEQVGPYEVKLGFMDANLRSFKRQESPIYKPLVIYDENRITFEEMPVGELQVLIAEGTYTSLLRFVDLRIFIDRTYRHTLEARKRRARDKWEPFIQDVLEREHEIISRHKAWADLIVAEGFDQVTRPARSN
jgi:uridine kinase